MARPLGSVSRHHLRIADPAALANLIERLLSEPDLGGVRGLARRSGLPPSRLVDWRQGRRHALSREQFVLLHEAVFAFAGATDTDPHEAELSLYAALDEPADGLGLWPAFQPPQRRPFQAPAFLEDLLGRDEKDTSRGRTALTHLERGDPPGPDSPFYTERVVHRPLYVTPKAFETMQRYLVPPPGFEGNSDGSPAIAHTDRGDRHIVWIQHRISSPH